MAKKMRIRKLAVVLLVLSMLTGMLGGFSAFAADKTKEITITTNTDDNPFLRVALYSSVFKTGGPFTVRCEMKIDSYTPNKSDANIFVNIADGRDSKQEVVWLNTWKRKTSGWVEMTDENGAYITFENINKVMISGALEDFALLQFGSYYVDSVIHYRNFRILNAAGSVVYSWDDDSSIEVGEDVRDLETRNLYGLTFGDGSADYIISESEAGGDGPAVTDPPTEAPTTANNTTPPTSGVTNTPGPGGNTTTPPESSDPTTVDPAATTTEPSTDPSAAAPDSSPDSSDVPVGGDPASSTPGTQDKGGLGVGAIIGIIAGAIVVLAGAAFGILYATKKLPWMKQGAEETQPEEPKDE